MIGSISVLQARYLVITPIALLHDRIHLVLQACPRTPPPPSPPLSLPPSPPPPPPLTTYCLPHTTYQAKCISELLETLSGGTNIWDSGNDPNPNPNLLDLTLTLTLTLTLALALAPTLTQA
eukprot:scaffold17716_cov21-Phaeocystis_antarctica.AAC.1